MTLTTPRSIAPPRPDRFWAGCGAVATGLVAAGVAASTDDGPILCPLRRCTGGYCPACGMTRATGELIRGRWRASIDQHPLLPLLVLQFVLLMVARAVGGPAVTRWLSRHLTAVIVAELAVLTAVWVARIATGAIPGPFGI